MAEIEGSTLDVSSLTFSLFSLYIFISNPPSPLYIISSQLLTSPGASFLLKSKIFKSISEGGEKSKKNKEPGRTVEKLGK